MLFFFRCFQTFLVKLTGGRQRGENSTVYMTSTGKQACKLASPLQPIFPREIWSQGLTAGPNFLFWLHWASLIYWLEFPEGSPVQGLYTKHRSILCGGIFTF